MALCGDVVATVLKKLPIDTRVALGVEPNKVVASDCVRETAARIAKVAAHPHRLRWTWVRVEGKLVRVIQMMKMKALLKLDGSLEDPEPFHTYVTECRCKMINGGNWDFLPIAESCGYVDITCPSYRWILEELEGFEKFGPAV